MIYRLTYSLYTRDSSQGNAAHIPTIRETHTDVREVESDKHQRVQDDDSVAHSLARCALFDLLQFAFIYFYFVFICSAEICLHTLEFLSRLVIVQRHTRAPNHE